ncbi:MAG: 3-hydroxyacyl-CoA dehydrogenase family protein, partial [Saprospiraceae bacterium]|nr:3-hydroxyacyl-CoA dehydrogenase family protein [Saprospiraceae bacterium]
SARSKLTRILNRLVEKERITEKKSQEIMGNILFSNDLDDCSNCEFIIEAIIEDLEVKKQVFSDLEAKVGDSAILATNTSSLSVASIASACDIDHRVIGVHFFNPAPLMKLVEIVPAIQTSKATLSKAQILVESWEKVTVIAKDTPGFIVNRVARPFYGEALRIYEENIADFATIDWAMTEIGGFRMGPFTLMDYIGNDVNYTVTETVFKAFYYDGRYKPAFTQKRLAEAGYLGRKSGRGYYSYGDDAKNPEPNNDEKLGEDIVWRILVMLINEAADALHLKIATKEDIDLAMTKGVNYPMGLLKWADEKGIENCVETLDRLFDEYHEERYRCSPLLRKMLREGSTFYN